MSSTNVEEVGIGPGRSGWALILPLLLSVLPLAFLAWETRRHARLEAETEASVLAARTGPLARLLEEASIPDYPARFLAGRLKTSWETADRHPLSLSDRQSLVGRQLSRPVRGLASQPLLWGVLFPDGDPNREPQAVSGPGLAPADRGIMTRLLRDLVRNIRTPEKPLDDPAWENRLRGIFGYGFQPGLFAPEYQGLPLPVVFRHRHGFMVWEICLSGDRVLGAFLLIMTEEPERVAHLGVRFLLERWRSSQVLPAILPLPAGNAPPVPALLHHRLDRPGFRRLLASFQRTLRVTPSPRIADALNRVSLPTHLVNRVVPLGPLWIRVCPLNHRTGRFALLVMPRRSGRESPLATLLWLGSLAWVTGLTLVLGSRFRTGFWPEPGVRRSLWWWFTGLVAVPLLAGALAGSSFLGSKEKNLRAELAQNLEQRLRALEDEVVRQFSRQGARFHELVTSRFSGGATLGECLDRARAENDPLPRFLEEILQRSRSLGTDLLQVVAVGSGTWSRQAGPVTYSPRQSAKILEVIRGLWGKSLDQEQLASETAFPGAAASPLPGGTLSDMLAGTGTFGGIEKFWVGENRFNSFAEAIGPIGHPRFVVLFIWDQEVHIRDALARRLRQESLSGSGISQIGFFGPRGSGEFVGEGEGLASLARQIVSPVPVISESADGRFLRIGFSLRSFPRLRLAALASLEPIHRQIAAERGRLGMLFGLALGLVLLLGWALSNSLAVPIVRMSEGLEAIAAGNLDVRVAEERSDELGAAGRILDSMTGELRERRKISRFVSPQVLEAVSGGTLRQALVGERTMVTILTSDIRAFTTLSEAHPPREIFLALNAHLQAMTVVIQSHGGIVERFIGDAVVAVFSRNRGGGRAHAGRALAAAREMRQAHERIQQDRRVAGQFPYEIGIGLESGEVVAGVVGDEVERLDFTVLGEPVARSAELESLSRHGQGSRIVASDAVRRANPAVAFHGLPGREGAWEVASQHAEPPSGQPPAPGPATPETQPTTDSRLPVPLAGPSPMAGAEVGEKGGSRGTPRQLVFLTLLWFLPLLVWMAGWPTWIQTRVDSRRALVHRSLEEDRQFLLQQTSPDLYWQGRLQRYFPLHPLGKATPASAASATHAIREEVTRRCRRLERQIPGLSWAYLPFPTFDAALTSGFSQVTVKPASGAAPIGPGDWVDLDLGGALPSGRSQILPGGEIAMTGGGFDIGRLWDSGHLRFLTREPDSLTALVEIPQTGRSQAMAGLMIRSGPEADAPVIALMARPGRIGVMRRLESGAWGKEVEHRTIPKELPRVWLSLSRRSNPGHVAASVSLDGATWEEIRGFVHPSAGEDLWGLVVCAGNRLFHPNEYEWPGFAAGGADPAGLTPADIRIWMLNLWQDLAGHLASLSDLPKSLSFYESPALTRWLAFIQRPLGAFREGLAEPFFLKAAGGDRVVFWTPFLHTASLLRERDLVFRAEGAGISPRAYDPKRLVERDEVLREMRGLVFLLFPSGFRTSAPASEEILASLRARGAEMAETSEEGTRLLRATPDFPTALASASPSSSLPHGGNDEWVLSRFQEPAEEGRLFLLARRITPSGSPTGEELLGLIVPGAWILAGWLLGTLLHRRMIVPTLRWQLLLAFLVALGPIFFLATLTIERSRVEGETNLHRDAEKRLQEAVDSVDEAAEITHSWIYGQLQRTWTDPALVRQLDQPVASGTRSDRRYQALLRTFLLESRDQGLGLADVSIAGTDGTWGFFDQNRPDQVPGKEMVIRQRVFRQLAMEMSRMYGDSRVPESRGVDMLIGSQMEEFQRTLAFGVGPRIAVSFMLNPSFFQEWVAGDTFRDFTWSSYVRSPSGKFFFLLTNWSNGDYERHQFHSFPEAGGDGASVRIRPLVAKVIPFRLAPDLRTARLSNTGRLERLDHFRLAPFPDHRLSRISQAMNGPVTATRGRDAAARLVRIQPSRKLGAYLIRGDLPVGRLLAGARRSYLLQEAVLGVLLFLALWLSFAIAGRFLRPIQRLVTAAERVARGDFTARLEIEDRAEFGVLAGAFNHMAREAQEGRLLGRFVSAAVRETARDATVEAAMREGQAGQAVVLFAGLGGFKELLAGTDPARLIGILNRGLSAMARIVRAQGGDIDKFIGEKILAVFPIAPGGDPKAAAAAALQAAHRIWRDLPHEVPDLPVPPGIGLTAGPVLHGLMGAAEVRLEMTILGDTVNLAARLADLASKSPAAGIVIDGAMADLGRDWAATAEIQFERLPLSTVKGKTREVRIFRAAFPSSVPRGPSAKMD